MGPAYFLGNRQSETRNAGTIPYVYSPPNWLYQAGSDTRTRTAYGNTASTSTASFTYDGYNRLATSQTASETTTYTYNALGERIKKINQNGLATSFHYGPDGELLYERDQAGNTKAYVWLDGRPLARIDNDAQIYYYHVDRLGTPQAMTNSIGTAVWKAVYEPFGKANVMVSTIENNLRLPGQYYDRETGLHYNYFRDYDPTSGRYIEFDLIGLRGGLNGYEYARSNPLSYIDPMGLTGVLPGPVPLPIPPPPSPVTGNAGGNGTYGELFPPAPKPIDPWGPDVNTEQSVLPPPPIKPPGQGGEQFCQKLLEKCMKGANMCSATVRPAVSGVCLAGYFVCRLGIRGGDHHGQ